MFSRRQPASADALASQETNQPNKLFPFSLSRIRSRTSVGTSEADIEMAPVAPAATMVTTASVRESRVAIIYVPWWFLVWANNRHSVRQNQPYLSRKMHISVEVAMLGVTVLCFIMMLILSRNVDVQYEVGFPYVTTLAALLGMQV
ncbi:unnamed protein product [Parascedosporium putredinis]|uniref:Uncharacterized protein n=1 Tax=Parascedosporium putredinis TaxID=1442378 RepID=A0A9P1HAH1_9PEZI|nr:unnamed protein product [Parascedosporium putredinis]CAI8004007.1 unnamed protein product [Parascedosporium putredinis]